MAPRPPWSRQRVVLYLGQPSPSFPLLMGSPQLHGGAAIVHEEGVYRLRLLECDQTALLAFREQQAANQKPFYPEHVDRFQRPTGEVLVEAADLASFLSALERIDWRPNW